MARKAFGPQRMMSPAIKARNVGESILLHEAEGDTWTWTQYGLDEASEQRQLVEAWLAQHQAPR
jgi:hypothetical protein